MTNNNEQNQSEFGESPQILNVFNGTAKSKIATATQVLEALDSDPGQTYRNQFWIKPSVFLKETTLDIDVEDERTVFTTLTYGTGTSALRMAFVKVKGEDNKAHTIAALESNHRMMIIGQEKIPAFLANSLASKNIEYIEQSSHVCTDTIRKYMQKSGINAGDQQDAIVMTLAVSDVLTQKSYKQLNSNADVEVGELLQASKLNKAMFYTTATLSR